MIDRDSFLAGFAQAKEMAAREALERVALRSDSDYGMGAQDMANEIYERIIALTPPAPEPLAKELGRDRPR